MSFLIEGLFFQNRPMVVTAECGSTRPTGGTGLCETSPGDSATIPLETVAGGQISGIGNLDMSFIDTVLQDLFSEIWRRVRNSYFG